MSEGKVKLPTSSRWGALVLIMGLISINYVDRVNLSVAAPTLMEVFGLDAAQMGILMSAFFWSYVLMQVPSGLMLSRWGAKMVCGVSCFGWGLATIATALVTGYWSFMIVRIALGITEAPAYPAGVQVVSLWIPGRERTFASACFDCCARIGSAIAPPLVAWIIVHWGWQASFVITGLLAVLYTFIWFWLYYDPNKHPKVSKEELAYIRQDEVVNEDGHVVTTKAIPWYMYFTYKKTLLLFVGYFCYLYFWNMFISWIPAYMVQARGMDLKQMGIGAMIPFLTAIPIEVAFGWMWDKARDKFGWSQNFMRKVGMTIGMFGCSFALLAATNSEGMISAVVWLTVAMCTYSGFASPHMWSMPNDIAPYGQGGSVGGTMSMIGQFSGLLAPMVAGFIIANGETIVKGYDTALYVTIALGWLGGFLFLMNHYSRLVPRNVEEVTVKL